jgi:hypothetical protein
MSKILFVGFVLNTIQALLAQNTNWQPGEGGVFWALSIMTWAQRKYPAKKVV